MLSVIAVFVGVVTVFKSLTPVTMLIEEVLALVLVRIDVLLLDVIVFVFVVFVEMPVTILIAFVGPVLEVLVVDMFELLSQPLHVLAHFTANL